jgi:SET domain-containing protein 6
MHIMCKGLTVAGALNSGGGMQIVAASPVEKGEEVHNTYGELGNADLVMKYGFALADNPFDAVLLDKARLLEEAARELGDRAYRRRCRFLAQERCGRPGADSPHPCMIFT